MLAVMGMTWSRRWRALGAAALDLVLPRTCPGCFAPVAWCATCAATIPERPRALRSAPTLWDLLATAALPAPTVHALTRYTGPARAAIIAGKERGRRDLPPVLGTALGRGLLHLQRSAVLPRQLWLVPAPSRRAAARARGGDPVAAMARAAARTIAAAGGTVGVAPCLYLAGRVRDSVGLTASQRAVNMAGAVRFRREAAPPVGAPIVVLDDVVTSGATLAGAIGRLAAAGWCTVGTLVVASSVPLVATTMPAAEARHTSSSAAGGQGLSSGKPRDGWNRPTPPR